MGKHYDWAREVVNDVKKQNQAILTDAVEKCEKSE